MMHKPVLTKEVLEYLDPKSNENFIDATIGQAGHTLLILEKNGPDGRVLGIDLDREQIENSKQQLGNKKERVVLAHDSYTNMQEIATRENFKPVHGILLDLGYSSWQIEASEKGFSFLKDEILDMRYNLESPLTAQKIVNEYSQSQLQTILEEYGEEKFAKKIAKQIAQERSHKKIESTFQLKKIIEQAVPAIYRRGNIHYATRSFQALRIAVNGELESLKQVLPSALALLAPGGRLVVISFHSLEDRIVKNFFLQQQKEETVTIKTRKPIIAGDREVGVNPRARSAKLRAIVKS